MAIDVFDLKAILTLDDTQFQSALGKVQSNVNGASAGLIGFGNILSNIGAIGFGAIAGLAADGLYNSAKDQASLAQLENAFKNAQAQSQASFSAITESINPATGALGYFATVANDTPKDIKKLQTAVDSTQESLEKATFMYDHATVAVNKHGQAHARSTASIQWATLQYDEATAALKRASGSQEVWTNALNSGKPAFDLTIQGLQDLAMNFERTSTFSHIQVQDLETMFMRYGVYSSDVMPQAIQATLDLSTAMGVDATTAAMKLGEAYKNPAQELTRLQALGVIFDANTTKQIKTLTAAGDSAGAFKIMLQGLQDLYGGSAAAAADTFNGKLAMMWNAIKTLSESIGNILLPPLQDLVTKIVDFIHSLTPDQLNLFANVVLGLGAAFAGLFVIGRITSLLGVFSGMIAPILGLISPLLVPIGALVTVLGTLAALNGNVGDFLSGLTTDVTNLWNAVSADIQPIIDDWNNLISALQNQMVISPTIKDDKGSKSGSKGMGAGDDAIQHIMKPGEQIANPDYKSPIDMILDTIRNSIPKFISDASKLISDAWSNVFQDIGAALGNVPGFQFLKTSLDNLSIVGVGDFGQGIQNFANNINGIDWSGIQKLVTALMNIGGAIIGSGILLFGGALTAILNTLSSGFEDFANGLSKLLSLQPDSLSLLAAGIVKLTIAGAGIYALINVPTILGLLGTALAALDILLIPVLLLAGALVVLAAVITDFEGVVKALDLSNAVAQFRQNFQEGMMPIVVDFMKVIEALLGAWEALMQVLNRPIDMNIALDIIKLQGAIDQLSTPSAPTQSTDNGQASMPGGYKPPTSQHPYAAMGSNSQAVTQNNATIQQINIHTAYQTPSQIYDAFIGEAKRRGVQLGF